MFFVLQQINNRTNDISKKHKKTYQTHILKTSKTRLPCFFLWWWCQSFYILSSSLFFCCWYTQIPPVKKRNTAYRCQDVLSPPLLILKQNAQTGKHTHTHTWTHRKCFCCLLDLTERGLKCSNEVVIATVVVVITVNLANRGSEERWDLESPNFAPKWSAALGNQSRWGKSMVGVKLRM